MNPSQAKSPSRPQAPVSKMPGMDEDEFDIWTVVLPALGVAFAAFSVWLTVRLVNRRERWAKWTFFCVIGMPTLYVLSSGPMIWLAGKVDAPPWVFSALDQVYGPLIWVMMYGGCFGQIFWRYLMWWSGLTAD